MTLSSVFDEATLQVLASKQSISRGRAYATDGRVTFQRSTTTELAAQVQGMLTYQVALSSRDGSHHWRCSCPVGATGEFCKHCVAAAIAYSAADDGAPADASESNSAEAPSTAESEADYLRRFLQTLSADELVDLLAESAADDDRLKTRLLRKAQLSDAPTKADTSLQADQAIDLRALKKEVTAAYGRGFVSYREAPEWAARVNDAIEWISDICDAGHFRTAALLAEHAHKRTETAVNRVDDSDGWITDIFHRIAEIHVAACAEGAFDHQDLARRLVKLELDAELDTFRRSAVSHAEALGPEGLQLYGQLVDQAFDKLPPEASRYGPAFRVRQARIAHAIATRDPDRLVAVMSDDIASPNDHLEIIDAFIASGRVDEALEWTEESLRVFADRRRQLAPIRERRADLLRERGNHEAVTEMYCDSFESSPSAEALRLYVQNAPNIEAATRHAADLPTRSPNVKLQLGQAPENPKVIQVLAVLLAAEQEEQAWTTALTHGASANQWHKMAEHRQLSDPEPAIRIFASEAETAINRKNRSDYHTAAKLLDRIERLAKHADRPDIHHQIIEDIKTRHSRKISLMSILDG